MKNLNCPNCGVPINGSVCEYCGTRFYDFLNNETNIDISKGIHYLRLKLGDEPVLLKVYCADLEVQFNHLYNGAGRDQLGRLIRDNPVTTKKSITSHFVEI